MRTYLILVPAVLVWAACGQKPTAEPTQPVLTAEHSSAVEAVPVGVTDAAITGSWSYTSLLPLNPDGSAGTDTTGLGLFHTSMLGTVLSFTDTLCEMRGKMGSSSGGYSLSPDKKSLTLRRKGKEQIWQIKELSASTFSYTTGGMPIVVVYTRNR